MPVIWQRPCISSGHEAKEMTESTGRLQDPPLFKAEPSERGIHAGNDDGRGIVGVECRGPGGFEFIVGEQGFQPLTLLRPFLVAGIEHLWQSAPTDIADQRSFLGGCGRTRLGFEALEQFDGGQVLAAFLLEGAGADAVGLGDAIVALVAKGGRFGFRLFLGYVSGGRRGIVPAPSPTPDRALVALSSPGTSIAGEAGPSPLPFFAPRPPATSRAAGLGLQCRRQFRAELPPVLSAITAVLRQWFHKSVASNQTTQVAEHRFRSSACRCSTIRP